MANQCLSQARMPATFFFTMLTAVTIHMSDMTQCEFIHNDCHDIELPLESCNFLKSERSGVGLWSQCSLIQFFCLSDIWTVKDRAGYLRGKLFWSPFLIFHKLVKKLERPKISLYDKEKVNNDYNSYR